MDDLKEAVKAISMLLDSAVHDYEKNDKCIAAVDFAMNVLRKHPNDDTISAIHESRSLKNSKWTIDDLIKRM